ncbi:23S rRNA (adenine(2030)-N(6))-methyltransferase RlmJ [Stappia sp. F7233]|uniref:Ribosomal RNA large subunit methyltransferase J n=1 Tax=Stappia albiluteola TaxID=2758565 RepID=A0A839AA39_9HYPH|nr:23S rRNA (adenine(2030)-N(6))-methyltransferase RlmJ [Stappia albiluteola]MBA5775787.1 23S rRNA (adenine(2030)-N(6))-methyltransferase RlmJ [Stappia albiluteola]
MNYRHIYHAGNIGDVLKHVVLAAVIEYLKRKPAAFRVIDTHAGIGLYDLSSEEARKTGEWQGGIGRILAAAALMPGGVRPILAPWLRIVAEVNGIDTSSPSGDALPEMAAEALIAYPGSPEIARKLLRRQDRLTLTELHARDFKTLSGRYAGDFQTKVIELDGWLALGSFLPPKERRGVVLIDPSFEDTREFTKLAENLIKGWRRWESGTYIAWYPIKDMAAVRRFHKRLVESGLRNILAVSLSAGRPTADGVMKSSGLLIVNPPWTLEDDLKRALPWLASTLATGAGAGWELEKLVDE